MLHDSTTDLKPSWIAVFLCRFPLWRLFQNVSLGTLDPWDAWYCSEQEKFSVLFERIDEDSHCGVSGTTIDPFREWDEFPPFSVGWSRTPFRFLLCSQWIGEILYTLIHFYTWRSSWISVSLIEFIFEAVIRFVEKSRCMSWICDGGFEKL